MSYDIIAADGLYDRGDECLHTTPAEPSNLCGNVPNAPSYRERVRLVARVIQAVVNKKTLAEVVEDVMDTDGGYVVKVQSRKARFRGRNSASQTVIVETIFRMKCENLDDSIPIKTVFKWYRQNDEDVLREAESYSCVVDKFETPFFAFPLCVAFPGNTPKFKMEDDARHRFGVTTNERLGFIVSENCGSMTLGRYVGETSMYRPFDREFYSAIVQVCLALEEMAFSGVIHHDMHFGNIMFPESREIVQNVGTKTRMCLAAKRTFLEKGEIGDYSVRVVTRDDEEKFGCGATPNDSEHHYFTIDRMVKIYDWDRIETDVPAGDKRLYHDKIGFLRKLVSLNFPMRAVLDSDTLEKLELILKRTEYKILVNGTLVKYAQMSNMSAVREDEVDTMKTVIDAAFYGLAAYAFLACLYYDRHPYDEEAVFGKGPMPKNPGEVFENLRSRLRSR